MTTKLKVLEMIDKYLRNLHTDWHQWDHLKTHLPMKYNKLGSTIKVLYHLMAGSFFNIDAQEAIHTEHDFNKELKKWNVGLCPSDIYKEFKQYHDQSAPQRAQANQTALDAEDEGSLNIRLLSIRNRLKEIFDKISPLDFKVITTETLHRLSQLFPNDLFSLTFISFMLREEFSPTDEHRNEVVKIVETAVESITNLLQFQTIADGRNLNFSKLPTLMEKISQLIQNFDDLKKIRVLSTSLLQNLTLSPAFINMACETIQTLKQFEDLWDTHRISILLLAKEPAFSYRIIVELNLSREQFFKWWKSSQPVFIDGVGDVSGRVMLELMVNTPSIVEKVNSYIQSIKDYNDLTQGNGFLVLAKIIENKKEAVALFHRIFANNLQEFFKLAFYLNPSINREPFVLTDFISYDENRKTLAKSITALQLEFLLPGSILQKYKLKNRYLTLSTEDEILTITTRIYPDFATFNQRLKAIDLASSDLIKFLFQHEKPRQYLAGLFHSMDQLLEFNQLKMPQCPHPAQTIADIIFSKPLKAVFVASITQDEALIKFPKYRATIVVEKIQEAIPHANLRDTNRIIVSYLFFAPPRVTPQLDLKSPAGTNQLALDRKI